MSARTRLADPPAEGLPAVARRASTALRALVAGVAVSLAACALIAPMRASDLGLTFGDAGDVTNAIAHAHVVVLSIFSLDPKEHIVGALEDAGRRQGSQIVVLFAPNAFGKALDANRLTIPELVRAGVHVRTSPIVTHLKAAIVDGQAYLSDTNFSAAGLVVQDEVPGDLGTIEAAIVGRSGANDHLWTRKGDALAAEARVGRSRQTGELDVATEALSAATPVYSMLLDRAKAGDTVQLLVAPKEARSRDAAGAAERAALALLVKVGVHLRLSSANEKMLVDGPDLWAGSANATSALPDQIEFAIAARSPALARALRARFYEEWGRAVPYSPRESSPG
jgi:hypothetical protein